ACDLARAEADKVRKIHEQLEGIASPIAGAQELLRDTDERIAIAMAFLNRQDYRAAYQEATRAMRPLRRLMRLEWEQAVNPFNGPPTASPFAVCYYTLPKQYAMQESIRRSVPGTNTLAGGRFEGQPDPAWTIQQKTLDDVLMQARYSNQRPHEGQQCLELSV